MTQRPPKAAAQGPPTGHLGTTSYLAFGTSPAEEKDMARLRPEGSSLRKEGTQKRAATTCTPGTWPTVPVSPSPSLACVHTAEACVSTHALAAAPFSPCDLD